MPGSRRRTSSWPSATTRWSTAPGRWNPSGTPGSSTSTSRRPRWTLATSPRSRSSPTCARRSSSWRRSWACAPSAKPPAPRPPDPRRRGPTPSRCSRSGSMADLEAALAPEDLVVSDVGAHKLWVAKAYGARLPNTVIISNGFAAMGIGLPGAIAAKLAEPGPAGRHRHRRRRVPHERAGAGDGAAARAGLRRPGHAGRRLRRHPLEQQKRRADGGRGPRQPRPGGAGRGVRLPRVPRRVGRRPPAALEAALASPVPALVDCPVDYAENDRLAEH